jgi:hypothetical protein
MHLVQQASRVHPRYRTVIVIESDNPECFQHLSVIGSHSGNTLHYLSVTPADSDFFLDEDLEALLRKRKPLAGAIGLFLLFGQMFLNSLF